MEEHITTKEIDDFLINESNFNFYFFRAMNRDVIDKFVTSQYIEKNLPLVNQTFTDIRVLPINERFKIIDRLFNLTALEWFYNIAKHEQALEKLVTGDGKKETINKMIKTRRVVLASVVLCKELVLFIFDDEYGDNGLMLNAELCCTPPYSELSEYSLTHIPPFIKNIILVYKEK